MALLLALVGCGGYEPTRLMIVNGLAGYHIEYVFISAPDREDWGRNALPPHLVPLVPGDSVGIAVLPGTYDLMIMDEDGDTYTRWEVLVDETGYTWNAALSDIDSSGGG